MENILILVHFAIAVVMVVLILIQQGKGAEMGAAFGSGGSNTMFGSSGGLSFFAKVTAGLATAFFVSSLALTLVARDQAAASFEAEIPFLEEAAQPATETVPSAASDIPVIEVESINNSADAVESAPADEIPNN